MVPVGHSFFPLIIHSVRSSVNNVKYLSSFHCLAPEHQSTGMRTVTYDFQFIRDTELLLHNFSNVCFRIF